MMVKQTYTVRFTTPAFLGDAEQNGAWRTPPFKALLRQWWRIAVAKDYGYVHAQLREAEGRLFGNAWLENNFSQSQIRLRLSKWREGGMKSWTEPTKNIAHPEIKFPIDANLYLGYGPLNRNKESKKTTFKEKVNAAIQANDENAELTVIFPEASKLVTVLQLVHWFGTLGGRSRNGWGSLLLENGNLTGINLLNQQNQLLNSIACPLQNCLQLDWPHALGQDQQGLLIWKTKNNFGNWRDAMKELAKIKIAFRTALHFVPERNHQIDKRHILAYPITHHNFQPWGNQARLANQLRFKVIAENNQLFGIAYHLPCAIPKELQDALSQADRNWINQQQLSVWQTVHQALDTAMQRI